MTTSVEPTRVGYVAKVTKQFEERILKDPNPLGLYAAGWVIGVAAFILSSIGLFALADLFGAPRSSLPISWVVGGFAGATGSGLAYMFLNLLRDGAVKELLAQAREWEKRVDLWSLFPPTQEQADVKLEALALTIRELRAAELRMKQVQGNAALGANIAKGADGWGAHVREQENAFHEAQELLRQLAPHVKLLEGWAKYVERYDARVGKDSSEE